MQDEGKVMVVPRLIDHVENESVVPMQKKIPIPKKILTKIKQCDKPIRIGSN